MNAPVLDRDLRRVAYEPPDAVIEDFHADESIVRGIKGPRGSGKSGACIMEGMQGAMMQNVNHDGKRRSRFLVLRDTYRQLETTTIPSFRKWLGHATRFTGQYPIRGFTKIPLADRTMIDMETVFLAMDGENIIDNLQSFEASFAWVNEARAIDNRSVINMIIASCGRFPSKDEEGCANSFLVMDTNPPDEFHWWYQAEVVRRPDDWAFFDQVSPLIYTKDSPIFSDSKADYRPNPLATYARIQNKGYDYWLDQIPGASDAFIRTMIMGHYGTLVMGRSVYGQFWSEDVVSRKPLEWHQTLPVIVGIDTSGLHPAACFGQSYGGRLLGLREVRAENTPFEQFVESLLLPTIAQDFRLNPVIAVCDPSNPRSGIGGKTAVKVLQEAGVDAILAPTNRLNERLGAVTRFLQRRGAVLIDPSMRTLIEGFRGKYHYKKIESSGLIEAYKPIPEKDEYADVHDAWQYLCLYFVMGAMSQKVSVSPRKVMMV